ncbi:MAG: SDR family oxidoreductase [Acidobacteriia bacterium]|nr:SDR family oxidoreductase [Terriglobia bacterium]
MAKVAVTGGAGFIGSNLAEHLLNQGHQVGIVDDFSTGREQNLAGWADRVPDRVQVYRFDINKTGRLRKAFEGVQYVFHQAAIPSVPRSIADPQASNLANISGTLSVLVAARDAGVKRVVVASSSSIYGDDQGLPKTETRTGRALSPYALSKVVSEEYCRLFHELYGLETVCLRYFNVFGPRQDPKSEYAAVIPRFATRLLAGVPPVIYGDGEQTRDFTYVSNVVDANWVAATHPKAPGEVFNIGCGTRTSLNQLVNEMSRILNTSSKPTFEPARQGDVRHSVADVAKAERVLDYTPAVSLREGLVKVIDWYRVHRKL